MKSKKNDSKMYIFLTLTMVACIFDLQVEAGPRRPARFRSSIKKDGGFREVFKADVSANDVLTQINQKRAFEFLRHKELISNLILEKDLQIGPVRDGWLEVSTGSKVFLLRESADGIQEFFHEKAKSLVPALVVFGAVKIKFDMSSFKLKTQVQKRDPKMSYVLRIEDPTVLAESLRVLHQFTEDTMPSLTAIRTQDMTEDGAKLQWSVPYRYENEQFVPVDDVRLALSAHFSARSPEVRDGLIGSFLFDSESILHTPFTKNNMVQFQPWSEIPVAVFDVNGRNVISHIAGPYLTDFSPFRGTVEDQNDTLIQFKE